MNTQDLLTNTWRAYRGKGATKTPVWGSEKANTVLSIANQKQMEWAQDPKNTWASNFSTTSPAEPGTVTTSGVNVTGTGTYFTDYAVGDSITAGGETRIIATILSDTALTVTVAFTGAVDQTFTRKTVIKTGVTEYTLNRRFYTPSDSVIVTTGVQDVYYNYTLPQQRQTGGVYIYGRPKKLAFYTTPGAAVVGGELKVAGYYLPKELVLATDSVAVDDPNWLVMATAAELARNDPAKDAEFGNLLGMANDLYIKMTQANRYLGFNQAASIPYSMPMIGGQEDW